MKYDFVFTFIVPGARIPFLDDEYEIICALRNRKIQGFTWETAKGYRVITFNSTRKKIEDLMSDLNGRHLRILDDYTFGILSSYINKDVK